MDRTFQYAAISLFLGLIMYILFKVLIPQPFYCATGYEMPANLCGNAMQVSASAHGEKLFKSYCASCHKLNARLIGPALDGVETRWAEAGEYQGTSSRDWLKRYIRNWQDPVEAGHPYAVQIIKFDASAMTQFPQLSSDDIDSILLYIAQPQLPSSYPVVVID